MNTKAWTVAALTAFTGLVVAAGVQSLNWQRLYSDSHPSGAENEAWVPEMAASPSTFVALLSNGKLLTSTDRVTWTPRTVTPTANAIAYGGGYFVYQGSNDAPDPTPDYNSLNYSTDGITWSPGQLGGSDLQYQANYAYLKYGAGRFLSFDGTYALTSANGINWLKLPLINTQEMTHNPTGDTFPMQALAATAGKFLAVSLQDDGGTSFPALISSTDGQTWSPVAPSSQVGHLASADITPPTNDGVDPEVVNVSGFVNIPELLAISTDGSQAVVAGEYASAGSYPPPYKDRKIALAVSSDGGKSWSVIFAADLPLASAFPDYDPDSSDFNGVSSMSVAYFNNRFVIFRNYDPKKSSLPFFTSPDGLTWSAGGTLDVSDRANAPDANSYVDSILVQSDGLYAAGSYYPHTEIGGSSNDLEFVTISRANIAESTPPPPITKSPAQVQLENKLAKLIKQLKATKKIADPALRAKKAAALKKKIKALKKKLAGH